MKIVKNVFLYILLAILLCAVFSSCGFVPAAHSFPSLINESERDEYPVRPIDAASVHEMKFSVPKSEENSVRMQLEELLRITSQDQSRPVFDSGVHIAVKDSYLTAVSILNGIIKNEWTDGNNEFEKVLAIYDYLSSGVDYDYDLFNRYQNKEPISDEDAMAFEIAGVFLNKRAVCDGLSKAFTLMCAIEGIESVYVRGLLQGGLHAWNKVKIDGKWYNADVTHGSFQFIINEKKTIDVLNHAFFLRSDASIYSRNGGYREGTQDDQLWRLSIPAANSGDYPFYETRSFAGIADCPMIAKNASELKNIFSKLQKSKNPKVGSIEVKLDFAPQNEQPYETLEPYSDAIEAAYRSVTGAGFSYNRATKNPPFVQCSGGVFLFVVFR